MKFVRDDQRNKRRYYQLFVLAEIALLVYLYYAGAHWLLLLCVTPIILLDAWSNVRCANRQKKYIREITIDADGIVCLLATGKTVPIPHEKCRFSIREQKFKKERTEIEIRQKRLLKSQLIGRIHIRNWSRIFEIRNELLQYKITQIKYRPEGYWSKYGSFTADMMITGSALALSEATDTVGDFEMSSEFSEISMPIREAAEDLKASNKQDQKEQSN